VAEPPAFARLRAVACYRLEQEDDDPIGRAVRALKYGRRRALAGSLSAILAERFPFAPGDFDRIAPVPLHLDRLRDRGFNQSLLLAREPARCLGRPVDAMLLERVRPTPPQVGLGLAERRSNLRGAFRVRKGRDVTGARVLLVDDVSTSGATADACATALLEAGARSVDVVTLARTLPH
jgi:ComF family protein